MTKAPLTAYEAALRARMITAARTLAHHRALKATKEALRARGLKPQQYSHRELGLLANEYAKRHGEELINDAAETIEQWRTETFIGKRAMAWGAFACCSALSRGADCSQSPTIANTPPERSPWTRGIQR